jgi:ubiquinone/menaquinone biosynthesis C-methylase UbiE
MQKKNHPTSWQPVHKWYRESVGQEGHYYHQHVILPGILKFLGQKQKEKISLLDIACGQGILGRTVPQDMEYVGIDVALGLIKSAKQMDGSPHHHYQVADVAKLIDLKKKDFTHAAIILALQNIEHPEIAFRNAAHHLKPQGKLILVMNHPCFRIPRQTSWQVDKDKKIQYRRIDGYMSPQKIPITTHPGQGKASPNTLSFHHPLSQYVVWLNQAGFKISHMEEWCSDKVSEGGAAKMENRARAEIPLFMMIVADRE